MRTRFGAFMIIGSFAAIIFVFSVMHILTPDLPSSKTENRSLQAFPAIRGIPSGNFQSQFNNYYSDQFPFRDSFLSAYTILSMQSPNIYVRKKFISKDGWIIPQDFSYSHQTMELAADAVNELYEVVQQADKKLYFTLVPQKSYLFGYKLPYPELTEKEKAGYFASHLRNEISLINVADIMDALSPEEKEDLFFKTDLHWNGKGAYFGFKEIIAGMIDNGDLTQEASIVDAQFDLVEYEKAYDGDLNRNLSYLVPKDRKVPYMVYQGSMDLACEIYQEDGSWQSASFNKIFASGLANYEIDYNQAYTYNLGRYIVTNKDSLTDQKILILKDSMQNPTTGLFSVVFRETEIVDVRNIKRVTAKEIIQESDADVVLIFYHTSNLTGEMYQF